MKKVILGTLTIILLFACNQKQRYTQNSPEIDTVKKLIANYNAKAYDPSVYADTSQTRYNSKENAMSPDETIAYHKQTDEAYSSRGFLEEDQEYEMVVTDDGETWVNCWLDWQGTVAGTSKKIDVPIHLTYRFVDGKIVREVGMWNPTEVVLAMQDREAMNNLPPEDNRAVVHNMYQAFSKGDVPTVLAAMDDNIIWNEAESNSLADGNPYKGPDAVLKGVFTRLGEEWENFRLVDIKLHEMANDQVLATLRYHGKFLKTGTSIDAQAAHLWKLRNGKVIAFQQYVDTKQLAEAENE